MTGRANTRSVTSSEDQHIIMARRKNEEALEDPLEVGDMPADSREARWRAHVARAEAQAEKFGTMDKFKAKKARGEFDKIPDSFK